MDLLTEKQIWGLSLLLRSLQKSFAFQGTKNTSSLRWHINHRGRGQMGRVARTQSSSMESSFVLLILAERYGSLALGDPIKHGEFWKNGPFHRLHLTNRWIGSSTSTPTSWTQGNTRQEYTQPLNVTYLFKNSLWRIHKKMWTYVQNETADEIS